MLIPVFPLGAGLCFAPPRQPNRKQLEASWRIGLRGDPVGTWTPKEEETAAQLYSIRGVCPFAVETPLCVVIGDRMGRGKRSARRLELDGTRAVVHQPRRTRERCDVADAGQWCTRWPDALGSSPCNDTLNHVFRRADDSEMLAASVTAVANRGTADAFGELNAPTFEKLRVHGDKEQLSR